MRDETEVAVQVETLRQAAEVLRSSHSKELVPDRLLSFSLASWLDEHAARAEGDIDSAALLVAEAIVPDRA